MARHTKEGPKEHQGRPKGSMVYKNGSRLGLKGGPRRFQQGSMEAHGNPWGVQGSPGKPREAQEGPKGATIRWQERRKVVE